MDPAVFGYIRVSQAEGESGLATQRRILTDHGLRDDRIFTDVASGRNMRRPAWKQLRAILQPGDVVVVPRIDRLARNLSEGLRTIEELHAQGIYIRSLAEGLDTGDDSPTSRLMLHMLLLPGQMGEGDHPGPDQGRRRPRRRRRPDRGQATGAGLREAAGRPGLPGQRRLSEHGRPGLRGEPAHREGSQGRDVPGPERECLLMAAEAEPGDSNAMAERQIFPLASGAGFAAVIHGNIVRLRAGTGTFHAGVYAFPADGNGQYRRFDTAAEATAWCVATAAVHQGKPNQYSHVEHWEVRNGNSITISRTESGDYKPDRHPIWVDSDHVPVMGFAKRFPSLDEALEWVRQAVDEESRLEADYQRGLRELREALESTPC